MSSRVECEVCRRGTINQGITDTALKGTLVTLERKNVGCSRRERPERYIEGELRYPEALDVDNSKRKGYTSQLAHTNL